MGKTGNMFGSDPLCRQRAWLLIGVEDTKQR
jgi:hypothetical protein